MSWDRADHQCPTRRVVARGFFLTYSVVMRTTALLLSALGLATSIGLGIGCGGQEGANEIDDHESEGTEPVGQVSSPLVASDLVSKAIAESCTTADVKGLSLQLIEELNCLKPNTMGRIDNLKNVELGPAAMPFLQQNVADGLLKVVAARGSKVHINSSLRSLPQQFLLYQWYLSGRCGIKLAAKPGNSNHESGRAVDVEDNAGWRSFFLNNGWRWEGAGDPVHYELLTGGADIRGLSVQAFQRLWNRNHPEDKIDEDGAYGGQTEARIKQSPIGGFAIGAVCPEDAGTIPVIDAGPISDEPVEDGPEPDPVQPPGEAGTASTFSTLEPADTGGCSFGGSGSTGGFSGFVALAIAGLVVARRRR